MKEIYGLKHLRESNSHLVYCPECGSSLHVVSNGWFHGELFYCDKCNQVYGVYLRKQKANDEFLRQAMNDVLVKRVRQQINDSNVFKVIGVLKEDK